MMQINPYLEIIQGHLSRADAVQLCLLCEGMDVVEFGVGGSTLLLAQCAKSVLSYDTDEKWLKNIAGKLDGLYQAKPNRITCAPTIMRTTSIPSTIDRNCDVMFVDGLDELRAQWGAKLFPIVKHAMIVHDCRTNLGAGVLAATILEHKQIIERIEVNPGMSNMGIVYRRRFPVVYEKWCNTERRDNRVHNDLLNRTAYFNEKPDVDTSNQ